MKKPSRLMPKYKDKPMSFTGWLIIALIFSCLIYYIYNFPQILILVPILYAVEKINTKHSKVTTEKHFNKILNKRKNDSICSFSRSFNTREIDTWVIRAVYEQLQQYMFFVKPNFPLQADDHLFNDLLIDDEDLDLDLVEEISERTGISLEHHEQNPYYGKVTTVRNLVLFFNQQKQNITSKLTQI